MKVTPLDLRQNHFKTALRGYDRDEVRGLLDDAADDYEHALRELDRLRQELQKSDVQLGEHREREANLRNTLLTAQKVADQLRENAAKEAGVLLRDAENRSQAMLTEAELRAASLTADAESRAQTLIQGAELRAGTTIIDADLRADATLNDAQGRVDVMLQKAHARLDEIDHAVTEMRLRKRDVESTLEQSIASLTYALEFVRTQDAREDKVRMLRPRLNDVAVDVPRAHASGEARLLG